jgi:hypothetical protein
MITVFFNEDGYYVTGGGVDIARRCRPAITQNGDRIFQPIHHTYMVLYQALCELKAGQDDVIVYNDSRIIDEINGTVEPIDDVCRRWLQILRQDVLPMMRSIVFFRKKATDVVNRSVAQGHSMLVELDPKIKNKMVEREASLKKAESKKRSRRILQRFKDAWLGKRNG